ncbi:MAG: pilus motility taxis protein HmpF [Leptolyngbyaceae cyanobacterium bins.349]|nr:pilus motility taxis protein HmpF [Leptolyngbyaceae cyanobacterium bins.349]
MVGVLYLAEVQKKSGGFIGGGKAELKLLACQRSEQNWTAVPGDETLPSDEANNYPAGALVLAEVMGNRQVQRVQEASRPLVSILQNFSRMQEKFKTQEEEIEQWKQSLTYQSQELNRREMDMEARREQLQQMEEDFEKFDSQRQELEALRDEIEQQKESYERNRQELEGAWEHLRGEMRRFEEQQSSSSGGLDEEKARSLQELLNRLSNAAPVIDPVREQVNGALMLCHQQQERLGHHWQTFEQLRAQADQQQHDVDQHAQDLHQRWQSWHEAQTALEQARSELKAQQSVLTAKQDYAQRLSLQLQSSEEMHQQLFRLAETSDQVKVGAEVDMEALEKMPLDELQNLAQDMESELAKLSGFVQSQEEELAAKQQEIEDLKAKIQSANEYDRLNLENELADEQDGYQMLNETLVGQRRNLQSRKSILNQHQAVLCRRQGLPTPEGATVSIDLSPFTALVETQRQQQTEELQKLDAQLEQMKTAIQQAEQLVTSQTADQENRRSELKQVEFDLAGRRAAAAEIKGRVMLYQEMLQPIQDSIDGVRNQLETMTNSMGQVQESRDYQQQAIAEMQQMLSNLSNPQFAVS